MAEPAQLAILRSLIGTVTWSSGSNAIVSGWLDVIAKAWPEMAAYCRSLQNTGYFSWCGVGQAYAMTRAGIRPPFGATDVLRFAYAFAWKDAGWGTRRTEPPPQPGDVAVFDFGGGDHHVTQYVRTEGSSYVCLGTNQNHAIKESTYPISQCKAIIRPPAPTAALADSNRMMGITATVFGGVDDPNDSAYDGHRISDAELGVALPYHFPKPVPRVRVFANRKSVECPIVDVGPWNTHDLYWQTGARPQAESGIDQSGRKTNRAGIDLSVAAARALGIAGKGIVDWEFITTTQKEPTMPTTTPATVPAQQFQMPHIDFAAIEKMVESVAFILPIAAGFVPQLRPFLPLVPVLEQVLTAAGEVQQTAGSGGDIWSVIAKHLHAIADQLHGVQASQSAASAGAPTNGMPNS